MIEKNISGVEEVQKLNHLELINLIKSIQGSDFIKSANWDSYLKEQVETHSKVVTKTIVTTLDLKVESNLFELSIDKSEVDISIYSNFLEVGFES